MLQKTVLGLLLTVAAGALAPAAQAQAQAQPPAPAAAGFRSPNAPLTVHPLRGGAYWVEGGVSNTGFVVGDKGVVAIDPQMFVIGAKNELAEVAKITPKPVNAIILTHSDPDHINGLPAYPLGMEIISHKNTKRDILGVVADPKSNGTPPPPEIRDYVPTHLVKGGETLILDGVKVRLLHVAPAHTDGDVVIYLPTQKVVFLGDLAAPSVGPYPVIHMNKHGSSLGWIAMMKAVLRLDADTFISGHGQQLDRSQVETALKAAEQRRAEIKALFDQHKTLDEAKAALNEAAPPPGPGMRFPTFTETTYQELAGTAPTAH